MPFIQHLIRVSILISGFTLSLCLALFGSIHLAQCFLVHELWIISISDSSLCFLFMILPTLTWYLILNSLGFESWMTPICNVSSLATLLQPWVSYSSTSQWWLCSWKFCAALRNGTQRQTRPVPRSSGETSHGKWLKWHPLLEQGPCWPSRGVQIWYSPRSETTVTIYLGTEVAFD